MHEYLTRFVIAGTMKMQRLKGTRLLNKHTGCNTLTKHMITWENTDTYCCTRTFYKYNPCCNCTWNGNRCRSRRWGKNIADWTRQRWAYGNAVSFSMTLWTKVILTWMSHKSCTCCSQLKQSEKTTLTKIGCTWLHLSMVYNIQFLTWFPSGARLQ